MAGAALSKLMKDQGRAQSSKNLNSSAQAIAQALASRSVQKLMMPNQPLVTLGEKILEKVERMSIIRVVAVSPGAAKSEEKPKTASTGFQFGSSGTESSGTSSSILALQQRLVAFREQLQRRVKQQLQVSHLHMPTKVVKRKNLRIRRRTW